MIRFSKVGQFYKVTEGLEDDPMKQLLVKFIKEEDGATMVEYAIMVALIAVVAIGIIATVGKQVKSTFSTVSTHLSSTTTP